MITVAGSIQSYIKGLDLKVKAELKKQSSQQNQAERQLSWSSTITKLNKFHEDNKQSGIVTKMMIGNKLTDAELEYLRKKNPGLYAKAVRIKQERECYAREVKRCKTKDEVQRTNFGRICTLAGEFKSAGARNDVGAATEVTMRAKAVDDEHVTYMKSSDYVRLPKNDEELKARRRKLKWIEMERVNAHVNESLSKSQGEQWKLETLKAKKNVLSDKRLQKSHYDKKV